MQDETHSATIGPGPSAMGCAGGDGRASRGPGSVSTALVQAIRQGIVLDGGWWPFDRFVDAALYTPGLGYYASGRTIFGASPASGSDFVTAPEMSPLFARALAAQVDQALAAGDWREVWEFGAGSGALAEGLLQALGSRVTRYTIVDLSGSLRHVQQRRLAPWSAQVRWADALPEGLSGVVIGNEVLDAMPFKRVRRRAGGWHEQGVALNTDTASAQARPFVWAEADGPCVEAAATLPGLGWAEGYATELHPQAHAWVATIAQRLQPGAMALLVDYGFPAAEYYHPQRTAGTLMCHRAHRADDDALADVGDKDITTHVDFTGVALAAQQVGAQVVGYTSQARFLLNCGLAGLLQDASLVARNAAHRLIAEHEMGELFKVIAFGRDLAFDPLGFAVGDRTHRL